MATFVQIAVLATAVYGALCALHALYVAAVHAAEDSYTRRRVRQLTADIAAIGRAYNAARTEAERAAHRAALLDRKLSFDIACNYLPEAEYTQAQRTLRQTVERI